MKKVLLIGSGFSSIEYFDYPYKINGWDIVVVNNGWQVCPDEFDYHVFPRDYKLYPKEYYEHQHKVCYTQTTLDKFGGQNACGMSATLNVGYWILDMLEPKVIGFLGCDMNYTPKADGSTHIYGIGNDIKRYGEADPDRMVRIFGDNDPNYLENIYMRFAHKAMEHCRCEVVNFSSDPDTRLPYAKARPEDFD